MADGAFSWGDKKKDEHSGKSGELPRHISRMNAGTSSPEAKGSVMKGGKSDSGLPWGGKPAEQSKAFATGLPKNKGSVTEALGQRTSAVGKLPHESSKAHAGFKMQIKSKSHGMKKK